MPGPIRNSSVARGVVTVTTITTIYTVPADTAFLLKDWRVYNVSGAQSIDLYFRSADTTVLMLFQTLALNANAPGAWSGWMALNAGDTLLMDSTVGGYRYWVSGALLPFIP